MNASGVPNTCKSNGAPMDVTSVKEMECLVADG